MGGGEVRRHGRLHRSTRVVSAERCPCLHIRCVKSGRMMKSSLTTVITMHEMHMAIVVVVASALDVMTVAEAPAAALMQLWRTLRWCAPRPLPHRHRVRAARSRGVIARGDYHSGQTRIVRSARASRVTLQFTIKYYTAGMNGAILAGRHASSPG